MAGGRRGGTRSRRRIRRGEGGEEAASVPTLNDSLGQPLPHMLSGEREARMLTQTNRWRGERGGLREVKLIGMEGF